MNLLAKEEFVWGFRTGFIPFAEDDIQELFDTLYKGVKDLS